MCSYRRGESVVGLLDTLLELFLERPNIQFMAPYAAILVGEIPERVGDRGRLEQIFTFRLGPIFLNNGISMPPSTLTYATWMPLRMEITRHHLGKAANGELGWSKSRRIWPWPDPRSSAGDENRAAPAFEHCWHDSLRPKERAECVQPPSFFKNLRSRLHETADRTPPAVVNQDADRPEFAGDVVMRS